MQQELQQERQQQLVNCCFVCEAVAKAFLPASQRTCPCDTNSSNVMMDVSLSNDKEANAYWRRRGMSGTDALRCKSGLWLRRDALALCGRDGWQVVSPLGRQRKGFLRPDDTSVLTVQFVQCRSLIDRQEPPSCQRGCSDLTGACTHLLSRDRMAIATAITFLRWPFCKTHATCHGLRGTMVKVFSAENTRCNALVAHDGAQMCRYVPPQYARQ
jgi:hypothetical protein